MKKISWLMLVTLAVGCGEGPPPELTPEKKAEIDAKMSADMQSMMGQMQGAAPPNTPKAKTP